MKLHTRAAIRAMVLLWGMLVCSVLGNASVHAEDSSEGLGTTAEYSLQWRRGAMLPRDLFPFSVVLPQLETSGLDKPGLIHFELSSAWSNTVNKEGSDFLIDVETRMIEPRVWIRLSDSLNLQLRAPLLWRGGGVLDEPIYLWHEAFGLPQGPRDNRGGRDNLYSIQAVTDTGETAQLRRRGFGMGDASLRLSKRFASESGKQLNDFQLGIQLPTGREEYGLEGIASTIGLQSSTAASWWWYHYGAQYSHLSNTRFEDFRFKKHMWAANFGIEFPFDVASVYLGLSYHSDLLANIPSFPSFMLYLDTGIVVQIRENLSVEILLRENPAPDTGTSDVTGYLSITYNH